MSERRTKQARNERKRNVSSTAAPHPHAPPAGTHPSLRLQCPKLIEAQRAGDQFYSPQPSADDKKQNVLFATRSASYYILHAFWCVGAWTCLGLILFVAANLLHPQWARRTCVSHFGQEEQHNAAHKMQFHGMPRRKRKNAPSVTNSHTHSRQLFVCLFVH